MPLLKDHLLDGCAIAVADGSDGLHSLLSSLGAEVVELAAGDLGEEGAAQAWAASLGDLDALVCDVGFWSPFDGLEALDRAWPVIQGVAAGAFIPAGPPEAAGATRKVLLIGPRPDAGADAEPARAALENIARTLSVEWARYQIVATMIAPGAETEEDEVSTLVAFLCSRAGHYYSGCRFSLGAVTDPR